MLRRRGAAVRLLEGEDCPPLVFGEIRTPGAKRTVMFYVHYDGQPVDPTQWAGDPWRPVLRDGRLEDGAPVVDASALVFDGRHDYRLYARSTSDDKAPIVALAAALDMLKSEGRSLSVNVKFLFEGEEEAGSPHLPALLQKYRDVLRADGLFICDGPVDQSGRMAIDYGVRGTAGLEMTIYGPNHPLHSGHYGNWAPNPLALMSSLLAGMRDPEGGILIAGFSDGVRPVSAADRKAVDELPDIDARLRREYGLAWSEAGNARLAERILLPALNIRGVQGGGVGAQAANAVPPAAKASIDFRLVPDQDPQAVRRAVEAHIRAQGFFILDHDPAPGERLAHPRLIKLEWEAGYPPYRLPLDHPFGRATARAMAGAITEPPVRVPTLGGSAPLRMFADTLGLPVLGFPIANYDNNQHGPNENIRLENFWNGICVYAAVLEGLGKAW
jgi:acetylornithine deacetylase/succinyl-diaminopimelate desuccinylase-like protein